MKYPPGLQEMKDHLTREGKLLCCSVSFEETDDDVDVDVDVDVVVVVVVVVVVMVVSEWSVVGDVMQTCNVEPVYDMLPNVPLLELHKRECYEETRTAPFS
jgi:hypothetical protein